MNKEKLLLFSLIIISLIAVSTFTIVIRNNGTKCLRQPFNYMMEELDLNLNCRCTDNKGEVYSLNKLEFKHINKPQLPTEEYWTEFGGRTIPKEYWGTCSREYGNVDGQGNIIE